MQCGAGRVSIRRMRRALAFLSFGLLTCSAPPREEPPTPNAEVVVACGGVRGPAPAVPVAECRTSTHPWSAGVKAFRDATADWGLDALNVEGSRISVTDLEGNGWADLVVRRVGVAPSEFSANKRGAWLLRNTGKKSFEDVTEASGFLARRLVGNDGKGRPGEVVSFGDVDNDGDLDGYTGLTTSDASKSLGETSELLLNDGRGRFLLGPAESALRGSERVDSPAAAAFVDFDLDGLLDVWVPRVAYASNGSQMFAQDRLFRGDGHGVFADVTHASGLTTQDWRSVEDLNGGLAHSNAWSGAACDLNGDGFPELLSASYGRAPNHLFQASRSDDTVRFVNRSVVSGYAYDNNISWEDNQFARCYCASRRSAQGCSEVPPPDISCDQQNWNHANDRQAFRLGGNSGTTTCADLDNDGDLDLLTSEIKHWWAGEGSDAAEILVNVGDPDIRFERPGREATGLVVDHVTQGGWDEGIMTNTVLDFDNDGWKDVYLGASDYAGNRGLLFHQSATLLGFEPVPVGDGIDHNRSHGVVHADFDRDGDLDILVGHSRARCEPRAPNDCYDTARVRLFENLAGKGGNWLQVRLVGCDGTNRAAIGARVTVEAGGTRQLLEVGGGHGHFGTQNDLVLHFGLGTACSANVSISWPNLARTTQVHTLGAGHRWLVTEGAVPRADDP